MNRIKLENSNRFALVDDSDFEAISHLKWRTQNGKRTQYAYTTIDRRRVLMHRLILNATPSQHVDHANGDGLDNRRKNIRLCTASENNANRAKKKNGVSLFKGVAKNLRTGKWHARISKDGKVFSLGMFNEEKEAAIAYNTAAKLMFGKFANINKI